MVLDPNYEEEPEPEDGGINASEFEHIAEIYDQIRNLHQKAYTSVPHKN